MAVSALKKITTRAKEIYRKGGTWKAAIKKAGAEYRGGKKVGAKKRPAKKRRKVGGTLSAGSSSGIMGVRRKRKRISGTLSAGASGGIMGLTAAQHISKAKKKMELQIGAAEVRKFQAKKKSVKNRVAKTIAALKSKYRKLC
jgi:hypothetical protein